MFIGEAHCKAFRSVQLDVLPSRFAKKEPETETGMEGVKSALRSHGELFNSGLGGSSEDERRHGGGL